jgi:riboflavin biosynthesis pyrimidine reductase
VDSGLTITTSSNIMQDLSRTPTLIVTTKTASDPYFQKLTAAGAELVTVDSDDNNRIHLKKLLKILAARNISSVLIEGGAQIITTALQDNLVNRLVTIIAPKIIGKGIEAIGDLNIRDLKEAKLLSVKRVARKGADVIMDSRVLMPSRSLQP